MRQRQSDRVLGPYEEDGVWRIIIVENGVRRTRKVDSLKAALHLKKQIEQRLCTEEELTLKEALMRYREFVRVAKQNKFLSIEAAFDRLERFFPDQSLPLQQLTATKGALLYQNLFSRYAAATHRRMLTEAKTFLSWCVKQKWLTTNILDDVEGEGKCRRGKKQLRFQEAKSWLEVALKLAHQGEQGAVAALMTLLLGLRASEIVSLTVRDIDDEGKLLWVTDSKTEAGKRTLEIPSMLRPFLQHLCQGKAPYDRLLGYSSRDVPRKWVQRICQLAQVERVTAHGMRGLHSTLALQAGATPHVVAKSLGHVSFATTLNHYAAPGSLQAGQHQKLMEMLTSNERRRTQPHSSIVP